MDEDNLYREDMQQAIAEQFGFEDYQEFQAEAAERLGKQVVRQIEKKLSQYPLRNDSQA